MRDQELDRLFDRFRRKGDVQALGRIFDTAAPELLSVAMSLVREAAEADDLLQETFLTAIERAGRYDAERRLVPWLLGILAHHARERRRRNTRALDAERLTPRGEARPESAAEARELEDELERALGQLSPRERSVLEAHLRQGKGAAEIAAETGAAPGAVRMQIHRGLDRLRRVLPVGLALGGAGSALGAEGAGSLAAVRATVLRAGEAAGKGLALGAGSALGGAGAGALLGKKGLLGGVLVLVVAGVLLLRGIAFDSRSEPLPEVARAAEPADSRPEAGAPREPVPSGSEQGSTRVPAREAAAPDPDRAGLRGRVVEADGTPVAGIEVTLCQLEEAELFPPLARGFESAPEFPWIVGSVRTDEAGLFTLQGARAAAIHALGLDLGGPRASLRMLEAGLNVGTTRDLGDVVLAAGRKLAGRLVDEEGRGIPGARVRVGRLGTAAVELGLGSVEAGGAFALLDGDGELVSVVELPEWLSVVESRLPFATTHTDADGRFRLLHVPEEELTLLIDAPGRARVALGPFPIPAALETLPDLPLERGRTARGRVVDAEGHPVADAEVRAGAVGTSGTFAALGPVRHTDDEGGFVLEALSDRGELAIAVRRDAWSPWGQAHESGEDYLAELPAVLEARVEVVDASGAPVPAPEIFLRASTELDAVLLAAAPWLPRSAQPVEGAPGRFALGSLEPGDYQLSVRAEGFAPSSSILSIEEGTSALTRVVLERTRSVAVLVRAAGSGESLGGARVRIEGLPDGDDPPLVLAEGFTDEQGRVGLTAPDTAEVPLWLHVEHPRFGPMRRRLGPEASSLAELTAGSRLVVHGEQPGSGAARGLLVLTPRGKGNELLLPRPFLVPAGKELVLEHLVPGKWDWELGDPGESVEILALIQPEERMDRRGSGTLTLVEGETSELFLQGDGPPAPRAKATLEATVRIDGRPVERLMGILDRQEDGKNSAVSGRGGRLAFEGLQPGVYSLVIQEGVEDGSVVKSYEFLTREVIDLAPGENRRMDYDLSRKTIRLLVQDGVGRPASRTTVRLRHVESDRLLSWGQTDADGRIVLKSFFPGHYHARASHFDAGIGELEVDLSEVREVERTLTLRPGTACGGVVHVSPVPALAERVELVYSFDQDAYPPIRCPIDLVQGSGPFHLAGLSSGPHSINLQVGKRVYRQSFELPENGSNSLDLSFSTGD